jgi:hypothetical protein
MGPASNPQTSDSNQGMHMFSIYYLSQDKTHTMNLEPDFLQPSTSMSQNQPSSSVTVQHSLLVPPVMFYPSYPSSTLHNHHPNPFLPQNFAHISSPPLLFSPPLYQPALFPSASQSRVPTIRGTPPPQFFCQLYPNIEPHAFIQLGIVTGNPGVFQGYPDPYPLEPAPIARVGVLVGLGRGFNGSRRS